MVELTPPQLVEFFCELFPSFRPHWDHELNCYRQGDDFTAHGVCFDFSEYFTECHEQASEAALVKLFSFVEQEASGDPDDKSPLANALCTCFLEYIAETASGERCLKFMGPVSKEYFSYWHRWPSPLQRPPSRDIDNPT